MTSQNELFTSVDGRIEPVPTAYEALPSTYSKWAEKGGPLDGRRLSIATLQEKYKVGESFHVIHVLETISEELDAYIMGPKDVFGEYLDGNLYSKALPEGEDPFVPMVYDGRVLPGPHLDFHFVNTHYKFDAPSVHEIVWKLGDLESNTLRIAIE